MFEKLESINSRYEELERLLADPEVISDVARYREYAKERAGYLELIKTYREYKKVKEELLKIEELLKKEKQDKDFVALAEDEIKTLRERENSLIHQIEDLLTEKEPDTNKNIIVEIRPGTGGEEASLFAGDLFRMYSKYAQKQGWKIDVMNSNPTGIGGFKEIIFSVEGKDVFKKMRYESGIHRVQRVPVTEAQGRIHTSAVTVAVLPEAQEVELKIDQKDLKIDVYRSSGPGGQSVNTTDSAVRITHLPTGIIVTCQDERSQLKNKTKALKILRARLLDRLKEEQRAKISRERKLQVGSGDRSGRIRTYNFPDRRVTDHRIGLTLHKLDKILEGDMDDLISASITADKKSA
ncbi:MAG: peptide chain release factor 1 [Candidatus Omnitrophica bacterium]|nr:peptide chain release factor 1 [Candidatus Omnitrophota bacterium]